MQCETCHGTGWMYASDYEGGQRFTAKTQCSECGGKGSVKVDPYIGYCPACGEVHKLSECRQVERDETCVYVCRLRDAVIEEIPSRR